MAKIKHAQGLDKPLVVQYGHFLGKFVDGQLGHQPAHGRLGHRR